MVLQLDELIGWFGSVPFIVVTGAFFWNKLTSYQRVGLIIGFYVVSLGSGVIAMEYFGIQNNLSAYIAGIYAPIVYCSLFALYWILLGKWHAHIIENPNQDQAGFARMAIWSKGNAVCGNALEKLTDPHLLVRVALKAKQEYTRLRAVEKVKDQNLLAQLAIQSKNDNVGKAAVKKIYKDNLLARVATEARTLTSMAAIKVIKNQSILESLANSEEFWLRDYVVPFIKDVNVLSQIAENDPEELVRNAALKAIQGKEKFHRLEQERKRKNLQEKKGEVMPSNQGGVIVTQQGRFLNWGQGHQAQFSNIPEWQIKFMLENGGMEFPTDMSEKFIWDTIDACSMEIIMKAKLNGGGEMDNDELFGLVLMKMSLWYAVEKDISLKEAQEFMLALR